MMVQNIGKKDYRAFGFIIDGPEEFLYQMKGRRN